MNAKILGLIPARYASTRFPGKPLADIGGKPMIQRVYERAASVLEHVYVATDDERIATVVRAFGGRVVMIADTHKSGTDRCAEAINTVQAELGVSFHAVINIQGDEPFIEPTQIELLASAFDDEKTEIATLVKPVDNQSDLTSPNKPKVVLSEEGNALYFSRQPIPYLRGVELDKWLDSGVKFYNHIGMYGYRSDILAKITKLPLGTLEKAESLEQLRWLENGYSIKVLETKLESLSIDTPEDLQALKDRGLI